MKRLHYIPIFIFFTIFIGSITLGARIDEDKTGKEKTFTVTKGGTLSVNVNEGDIRIRVWEKNEIHVEVSGEDEDEELDAVRFRQRENTVYVEYDPRWGSSGDMRFDISMPAQFNITMETSAGDMTIDGNMTGSIKGETSGGNIRTKSVKGTVELSTSGGDISTEDIDGDLTLNTSGGDIRVGKVSGTTDVHTSGGEISITSSGKSLVAETAGGNVSVGDINGDAIVETAGGDIFLEKVSGGAKLKTAGGNIHVSGANGKVSAKTAGGDIIMEHIVGAVDAKTSAGNLDIELTPTGTAKSVLTTSVGDAILRLPGDAKASISATVRIQGWWKGSRDEDYIFSDFEANTYDKSGRDREIRASYTLNGGGQTINIQTSMGNIHLLKIGSTKSEEKHKSKER